MRNAPRVTSLLALVLCASQAHALAFQQDAHPGSAPTNGAVPTSQTPGGPIRAQPLLPPAFASEPREGSILIQPTPAGADAAHAAVLQEDGFVQSSMARYAGTGPAAWNVQVIRFGDATGAYSAFTFYRAPEMEKEAVGDDAAASANVFLVRSRASLVIARAADAGAGVGDAKTLNFAMQALVQSLPRLEGPDAIAPVLPGLMPAEGLEAQSLHYAVGPASYNGPIPVLAIDFSRSAEAATARYRLSGGSSAVLTLLMLPTPQIAGSSLRSVAALPDAALHVATRRIGPLVAVVSGPGVSLPDAQRLLGQIHYVADITLDQPQGYTSEVAKAAKLLLGIAYLTGILAVAAVLLALFLGGGRLLVRRMRGKPDSSLNDDDFISLKL